MSNKEKYINCFVESLEVDASVVETLEYQGIQQFLFKGNRNFEKV